MSSQDPEQIRRRMAELRREMECDVNQVRRGARQMKAQMTDWTYYVRKFPWAVAGAAVVAGYLLVPKKRPVIKPDPEMLAELVKQNKVKVQSTAPAPDNPGMMKSLLMMGLTWAARTGFAYMTQRITEAAHQRAQATAPPERAEYESHDPGPSPLHEPWSSSSG